MIENVQRTECFVPLQRSCIQNLAPGHWIQGYKSVMNIIQGS